MGTERLEVVATRRAPVDEVDSTQEHASEVKREMGALNQREMLEGNTVRETLLSMS